ncbi:MAG: Holliday junction branch migration protein RuvA [Vicinamibacteria bacterium]
MIGRLQGRLLRKRTDAVLLDVGGVGYRGFIPLSSFYALPKEGEEILLEIVTVVREDALHLYGFVSEEEKEVFELLTSVSGIGPRLAINTLSGIRAADLVRAIQSGDLARLVAVPGIGRKTAERLIIELKDRVEAMGREKGPAGRGAAGLGGDEGPVGDCISALVNLGYKRSAAEAVVAKVRGRSRGAQPLETLLRESLAELSRG